MSYISQITSDGVYRIKVLNKDFYAKYIHDDSADPWIKLTTLDTSSAEQKVFLCSYPSFSTLTCTTVEDICGLRQDGRLYNYECCRQRRVELQENFADVLGIRISPTQSKFHVLELEHSGEDE